MRTSRLYDQLQTLLGQPIPWVDRRHLQTLIWMVVGVICAECVSLPKWSIYSRTRAMFAQSHQRRFSRWLHNSRINIHKLYSPLIQAALADWESSTITLIEDTSMLWNEYCLVRLSVQYRGRAVPLVWRVIRHRSSSIQFSVYQTMLKRAARLLPAGVAVCFLADRGFADVQLMRYLRDQLHWNFRIRVKSSTWIHRPGKGWKQLNQYHLALGEVLLLQGVSLTKTQPLSALNLALGRAPISGQPWLVATNEPATLQTFREYALRFAIEEEFLDEKSNGFQLERSEVRSPIAHFSTVFCASRCHTRADRTRATSRRQW